MKAKIGYTKEGIKIIQKIEPRLYQKTNLIRKIYGYTKERIKVIQKGTKVIRKKKLRLCEKPN